MQACTHAANIIARHDCFKAIIAMPNADYISAAIALIVIAIAAKILASFL